MFGDSDARRDGLEHVEPVEPDAVVDQRDGVDPTEGSEGSEAPVPPVTGDPAVDEAMTKLARSQAGSFAERIESGEDAHRSLQSRLGGLGGA
jgi:hypothetical protein